MLKHISMEDIPQRYMDIVDAVGVEGFRGLVQLFGGSIVYFPTVKSLSKSYRNRVIRDDFKGDLDELAIKYGLSRSQVYNIIYNDKK